MYNVLSLEFDAKIWPARCKMAIPGLPRDLQENFGT